MIPFQEHVTHACSWIHWLSKRSELCFVARRGRLVRQIETQRPPRIRTPGWEKLQHKRNVWRSANIYWLNRIHVRCTLTKRYLRSYGNLSTINSGSRWITSCYYSKRRLPVNVVKAEITRNWMENSPNFAVYICLFFKTIETIRMVLRWNSLPEGVRLIKYKN